MATDARIVETHISTLFFVDDRVFKRKKPIATGFVDFRDADARRAACEREVELNRRLAPDIYLGVASVVLGDDVLDHLVVMRRVPDDRRLSRLLDDPSAPDLLRQLARVVAAFHERAERAPEIDAASGAQAVRRLWEAGIEQMAPFADRVIEAAAIDEMATLALEYVDGRAALLEARVAQGRACDGHGDLQAEDVFCLDDGPRILDCLEFDDQLRYGDVLADVAFLAMDLERLGHPELGATFLDHYRELSGDHWPDSLAHLHIAYRAHVRAKVTSLRHDQGDPDAADAARALHALCCDHLRRGRVGVVLVGGAPGSGKTTVARGLADALGAVVLSSDELRGDVVPGAGEPNLEVDGGRYAPERRAAVYDELLERAASLLRHGERVVLDASWLDPRQRERARTVAAATSSPVVEVRCDCPAEVAAERIRRRAAEGTDASEVTVPIAEELRRRAGSWPEAVVVDTGATPEASVAAAVAVASGTFAPPRPGR